MSAVDKNLYTGSSTAVLYTDQRNFYISPNVVKKNYPLVTPFLTATSNWGQVLYPADPQYKMFQYSPGWVKQYFFAGSTVTSAADNAEDTLTITATGAVGMPSTFTNHLLNLKLAVHSIDEHSKPTGAAKGVVVITTFTSATSVNVKNLGSSSVTITSGDALVVIGTAFGEGTVAAKPSYDGIKTVWNQAGIHKTSFQLTKTLMAASLRGESKEYDRLKVVKMQEHQIQKERDLLFSISSIGTNLTGSGDTFGDGGRTDVDGNTIRSTYGVFQALLDKGVTDTTSDDQNIFDIALASYSYSNFVDDSEKIFEYMPEGVMPVFSSDKLISYFNKVEGAGGKGFTANSKWQPGQIKISESQTSKMGFNFRELESPNGTLQFIKTPVITKSPYNGYGMAVDPANIFHVVYRKPEYQQNIDTNDAPDYQKNQYFSDEGAGITNLPNHKMFRIV